MQASSRRRRRRLREVAGRSAAAAHRLRWRSSVSVQALDQLGAGVIVADAGGRVVEMNRAAEAIVRAEDGLIIRDDRLCARRAFETAKVSKLITGAAVEGKAGAAAGRMLIERSDSAPAYVLTVAPLRVNFTATGRPLAMIVVVDPKRHTPSENDLAQFFGLSPAEARLAAALLSGKRLSEIAGEFRVRVTTLRTQLASILRKAGVDRQFDLVRLLSGIGIGSASLSAGWLEIGLSLIVSAA